MKQSLIISALLLAAVCEAQNIDPSKWDAGQVLSESAENLDGEFRIIRREIVNTPQHWEGIGHFSFLYYRDRLLCKCGHGEFSIAPSNKYAILKDGPTGKLLLFKALTGQVTEVTEKYVGSPQSFIWEEAKGLVTVIFYQGLNNVYKDAAPLSIELQ